MPVGFPLPTPDEPVAEGGGGGGASSASELSITDSGAYYTATDVEGALQEIGAGGIGGGGVQGYAQARETVNQTIGQNVWTTVNLSIEDHDTENAFASNTYTAPETGVYLVTGAIFWAASGASNTTRTIRFLVDGTDFYGFYRLFSVVSQTTPMLSTTLIYLTAGQTVVMQANHNEASLDIFNSGRPSMFSVARL